MRWNNRNIGAYHKQIIQTFKIHNAQIDGFNKPKKVYEPIHHSRIIGIDQASHMASTELQTSLMITSTPELAVAHNTTGEPVPFAIQLEYLSTLTDSNGKPFLEHDTPSRTKQREPRKRTFKEQDEPSQSEPNNNNKRTSKDKYRYKVRDGRRKKVEPILLVSHNLET